MTAALPTLSVTKPWGRAALPAPFANPGGESIGEIWFEPPAALPDLLVKYIFTSDKLSVQVHPSDAQTLEAGLGRQGKEECWLVIDAEPDARLAIGFAREVGTAEMREAALDGSIEELLLWHPVSRGDFFYIPANTVHAIGAGVSLIEVQQNSDITYRLYDYGRPRELHLDQGLSVALGRPYDLGLHKKVAADTAATLVEGPLFRLDQLCGSVGGELAGRYRGPLLAIPLSGGVRSAGEGLLPGQCGLLADISALDMTADAVCLVAQPAR